MSEMMPILSLEDEQYISDAPQDALREKEAYIDVLYNFLLKQTKAMCIKQAFYNHLYRGIVPRLKVATLYAYERYEGVQYDIVNIFQNYDVLYRFQNACGRRVLSDYQVQDDVVTVFITFDHPNDE